MFLLTTRALCHLNANVSLEGVEPLASGAEEQTFLSSADFLFPEDFSQEAGELPLLLWFYMSLAPAEPWPPTPVP